MCYWNLAFLYCLSILYLIICCISNFHILQTSWYACSTMQHADCRLVWVPGVTTAGPGQPGPVRLGQWAADTRQSGVSEWGVTQCITHQQRITQPRQQWADTRAPGGWGSPWTGWRGQWWASSCCAQVQSTPHQAMLSSQTQQLLTAANRLEPALWSCRCLAW